MNLLRHWYWWLHERYYAWRTPEVNEDEWVAAVQRAADRWERNVSEVSLEDWQNAALDGRWWL